MDQLIFDSDIDGEDLNFIENLNSPLNSSFEESGFSTKNIIKNLGSTFVYLMLLLIFIFMVEIIKQLKFIILKHKSKPL